MSSPDFDNVKVQKAKAIATFNRFRKIAKLLQVVALAVLWWSSIHLPAALKTSRQHLLVGSVSLFNPLIVFLMGNFIIVALFVLSRQNGAGVNAGDGDIYDDYVVNSQIQQRTASVPDSDSAPSPPPSTEEYTDGRYKGEQIDHLGNDVPQTNCDAVAMAIEKATKRITRFQRTQSDKLKRKITVKPQGELRRQQTEMRQIVLTSGEKRIVASIDRVNSLSNEEFRLWIEAVIAERRKDLYAQRLAEEYQ